jgi:hypothetical protein
MIISMNATVCCHEFIVRTSGTRSLAATEGGRVRRDRKTMMTSGNENFKVAPKRAGFCKP